MSRDESGPKVFKTVIRHSLFRFILALAVKKLQVLIPQHHATTQRDLRVVSSVPSGVLRPTESISTITVTLPAMLLLSHCDNTQASFARDSADSLNPS